MVSRIPAKIVCSIGLLMLTVGQNTGAITGIEVALSEGQTLVNGLNQPNGQIIAKSNQIAFVSLAPTTLNITDFGGACGQGTAIRPDWFGDKP